MFPNVPMLSEARVKGANVHITSTFLSLLVIPVIFTFVDEGVQWLEKGVRRRHGRGHGHVMPPPVETASR